MTTDAGQGYGEQRALVVDDDDFMRKMLVRITSALGFKEVAGVGSGAEALVLLADAAAQADLLLLDINMPGMDGIEFLRHLADQGYDGRIVLVSGEDIRVLKSVEGLAAAHSLEIAGALKKPIKPADLAAVLSAEPERRRGRRAAAATPVGAEDLARGIDEDELVVFFQPKVSPATRALIGVETLVRWQHPRRGMLAPDVFVPVAESAGLIDALTRKVFALAMREAGSWAAAGHPIKVAVNFSVDNLRDLDLPERLVDVVRGVGVDPALVVIEVTESRIMQDVTRPLEILARLRLKGIELSIDDFGTGSSSMLQLKRLPFSEMKIDRAFVHGAARDDAARAILEASCGMARKLGMSICAEGVEDEGDWEFISRAGVDSVQGFFAARPMPATDIVGWLERWAAVGGESGRPPIDLAEMAAVLGTDDMAAFAGVFRVFEGELGRLVAALEAAVAASDAAALRRAAHAAKSAASSVGATALHGMLSEIEGAGAGGDWRANAQRVAAAKVESARALAFVRDWLGGRASAVRSG